MIGWTLWIPTIPSRATLNFRIPCIG